MNYLPILPSITDNLAAQRRRFVSEDIPFCNFTRDGNFSSLSISPSYSAIRAVNCWVAWDAFYQEVTQEGVEEVTVIIDDGWQSVVNDRNQIPTKTQFVNQTEINILYGLYKLKI
jgi:hypothetical protein